MGRVSSLVRFSRSKDCGGSGVGSSLCCAVPAEFGSDWD